MSKTKFILTVDVEPDRSDRVCTSLYNLTKLGRFQDLCISYDIKPTYLCTYETIVSRIFERFLHEYGTDKCEIGVHLHPWSNPPFVEIDESGARTYPFEYPLGIFRDKMEMLISECKKRGITPRSYRAGRYGFSSKHIPVLREFGITTDCSVTPFVSWRRVIGYQSGGPDYGGFRVFPFLWPLDRESLLEVPITILPVSSWTRNYSLLVKMMRISSLLPQVMARRFKMNIQWFRPYPDVSFDMLKAVVETGLKSKLPVLVMFMHSNELHEDCNPYFKTKEQIEYLYNLLERVFTFLNENSVESVTLSEFAGKFLGYGAICNL